MGPWRPGAFPVGEVELARLESIRMGGLLRSTNLRSEHRSTPHAANGIDGRELDIMNKIVGAGDALGENQIR